MCTRSSEFRGRLRRGKDWVHPVPLLHNTSHLVQVCAGLPSLPCAVRAGPAQTLHHGHTWPHLPQPGTTDGPASASACSRACRGGRRCSPLFVPAPEARHDTIALRARQPTRREAAGCHTRLTCLTRLTRPARLIHPPRPPAARASSASPMWRRTASTIGASCSEILPGEAPLAYRACRARAEVELCATAGSPCRSMLFAVGRQSPAS